MKLKQLLKTVKNILKLLQVPYIDNCSGELVGDCICNDNSNPTLPTEEEELFETIGGETSFTLLNTPNLTYRFQLFRNGILQPRGTGLHYELSGNTVSNFFPAIQDNEHIQIYYKY